MNKLKSQTPDSDTTTCGFRVQAAAHFLPDQSYVEEPQRYVFMYRIVISNVGERTARLRSRHWIIKDAFNEREDVRGEGVRGEHPVLAPGESFEYRSTWPLPTKWGTMEGSYSFEDTADGSLFDVEVGRFFLVPTARIERFATDG